MPFNTAQVINLGKAPTASDVILKFIRDSIADGSLDEGEPIRQDDVARLFNVSKIPVREALKRLEAEGLVEFHRNKGAIVTSVSEPEIAQIFEVRAILESNAIKLSIPHMTERTFETALAYCDAFAEETDVARWSELNWRFHSCLYEDARRPFLVNTIRSVNDRLERYLRVQLTLSHGKQTADREHRQILDACRGRDEERAAGLLYAHIMSACQSLLEHLPAKKPG
ncbi:GntR family transcriptional regulator [Rhizobium leguminosarum bv. trifolii]|uniref:GntR family transcriptional regulator n=1 Tax=Rhizobium leguminosarum bv. trifolii TaxID=386 RepID=A0A3E1AZU0_RHILT|nr:GntR family transcriptional regulator [Rhizobium leguminosarum]RFB83195.1 GntR family transcriptional regulator [Rhizobium leguminosarum bv. trifolii]RFB83570.1 GntR family transcriptional regulator [Rhizobium leguminosarum bv. trifolii]